MFSFVVSRSRHSSSPSRLSKPLALALAVVVAEMSLSAHAATTYSPVVEFSSSAYIVTENYKGTMLMFSAAYSASNYYGVQTAGSSTALAVPASGNEVEPYSTNGTISVGAGSFTAAAVWNAAGAGTLLATGGFTSSPAAQQASDSGQIVGVNGTGTTSTALLWATSASTPVSLNNTTGSFTGFTTFGAYATDGTHQAGTASTSGGVPQVILWNGTAASAVALGNPLGTSGAITVKGVSGTTVVGWEGSGTAFRYNGSTFSTLTAPSYSLTYAYATNGTVTAGFGDPTTSGSGNDALVWDATGAVTDLGALLPGGMGNSEADSVDANGDVFGHVETTASSDVFEAVEWVATTTPEPSSMALLLIGGCGLLSRRRRAPGNDKA